MRDRLMFAEFKALCKSFIAFITTKWCFRLMSLEVMRSQHIEELESHATALPITSKLINKSIAFVIIFGPAGKGSPLKVCPQHMFAEITLNRKLLVTFGAHKWQLVCMHFLYMCRQFPQSIEWVATCRAYNQ